MFDADELPKLRDVIRRRTELDKNVLDELCAEVRQLAGQVRTIKPRSVTAISLVASDGGNNKLEFDPFYVQLVRVVDSYGKQLFLDAISPTTDPDELSAAQFHADGTPQTPLGQMMADLDVRPRTLNALSHMIPPGERVRARDNAVSPSWVLVYRDLCEWAVLYQRICHTSFGTDTLIVRDGLLRSKLFRGELFVRLRELIEAAIDRHYSQDRRRIFLVGLAKHSKVIARYHLAMAIENTMPVGDSRYVRIPRDLEGRAYVWPEYSRGVEVEGAGGEAPKFVAGDLYLVRFGPRGGDPIWAVDILSRQSEHAPEVFGYLLADAVDGFPVPFYPRCLQRAHEHAQVVDFDLEILQNEVYQAVRQLLPQSRRPVVDALRLNSDAAMERYE